MPKKNRYLCVMKTGNTCFTESKGKILWDSADFIFDTHTGLAIKNRVGPTPGTATDVNKVLMMYLGGTLRNLREHLSTEAVRNKIEAKNYCPCWDEMTEAEQYIRKLKQ